MKCITAVQLIFKECLMLAYNIMDVCETHELTSYQLVEKVLQPASSSMSTVANLGTVIPTVISFYSKGSKFNSTALVGYKMSKLPNTSGCKIPKVPITTGSFSFGLVNTISAALPGK